MEKRDEFILKEYEVVRSEMDETVKETRVLERYALIVFGGIWSWYIANPGHDAIRWLPFPIIFFLALRAKSLIDHIKNLEEYLMKIEQKFALPDNSDLPDKFGFEHYFKQKGGTLKRRTTYFFWAILVLASLIIPIFFKVG